MLALYLALKGVKRTHVLISTPIGVFGIIWAVTLRIMSQTNNPGLKIANLLLFIYTLIIGIAMLAGTFSRRSAYLAIITGIIGIVGLVGGFLMPGLEILELVAGILWSIWFIVVGFRLYKLAT